MIINHNGQKYEITNWKEFSSKLLYAIGFQAENEIRKQIDNMRLVDTGELRGSLTVDVEGNNLVIGNTAKHAPYLEYGSFAYFDQYGKDSFPSTPDPKKKNISRKAASKLPKGVQPFGFFRKVLWNQNKMAQIINKAVKSASK